MKRKSALLTAVVLVFALLVTACGAQTGGSGKKLDTLPVNVGPDPDTIDPALNTTVDGGTMIAHAFEGLMRLNKDGKPVEAQAKTVKPSDDLKTYTFTLRDDLKWSDGQPIKAGDFVYAWNRAALPDTGADYAYMFDIIEGYEDVAAGKAGAKLNVTAPDDKTLVVKLNAPTPYFLEVCAFPTFMPVRQDIVEANGEAWATKQETYIGNGPYKIIEWVEGSHITMQKNENYWEYNKLGTDKIKFVLMEEDTSILSAYKNKEILFADTVPTDEMDALKKQKDFHLEGQLGTYYVSFNVKKPPLDNPKVRQALILAVDRDYIVKQIGKAGQVPAGAYVPLGLTDSDLKKEFREVGGDYFDPTAAANEANLKKAKELLAEAGYPDGKGLPTMEYIFNEGSGHQAIGEALQNMWKEIGVNVTLSSQEWQTFTNTRKNGEYYIARNGWLCDYNDPISMLDMWITGGGNNDAQWSNSEYDKLIKQIKASSDNKERYELMHKAEKLIFDDWMLCPIYYYVDVYLQSEKISGFYSSPLGFKYFMYATATE